MSRGTADMAHEDVRMSSAPVSRPGGRLGMLLYDVVKARLLDGEFAAGERIPLDQLKRDCQVSKAPIMDAMRQLAAGGLIEIVPQVGCLVPRYAPAEVSDFFVLLGSTEGAIAAMAAQRWRGDDLGEVARLNSRIAKLKSDGDAATRSRSYLQLNRRLHQAIHSISGSRVVADVSERMFDLADILTNTAGVPHPLAGTISERVHDHDVILAALRRRDAEAARTVMERHIKGTVDIILGTGMPVAADG